MSGQGINPAQRPVNPTSTSPMMNGNMGMTPNGMMTSGQQQQQLPGQMPIQNPPQGGVLGAPGYSTGTQPQLSGNYWNQVAQQLAGPTYLSGNATGGLLGGTTGGGVGGGGGGKIIGGSGRNLIGGRILPR